MGHSMSNDKLPLYQQIQQYILTGIHDGKFPVGQSIPTEMELCEMFNASRATVNKAMTNLALQGNIYRTPGKGSYVRMGMMDNHMSKLLSFSEMALNSDIKYSTVISGYSMVKAETILNISNYLNAKENSFIHKITRNICSNNKLIAVEISYINSSIISAIDISKLGDSIYKFLENQMNLQISHCKTTISAMMSNESIDSYFGYPVKEPILFETDITYLTDEQCIEVVETYFLGSEYTYVVELNRK